MRVRVRAGRSPVIEGNCVAARRGGEQPEVNRQSVGARTCFGGMPWRACSWMAKPGTTNGAEATDKAAGGRITWLRSECRDGEASGPERPRAGGDGAGSQNLHITEAASSGGEGRMAKPSRGKGGRKLETGSMERSNRSSGSADTAIHSTLGGCDILRGCYTPFLFRLRRVRLRGNQPWRRNTLRG